MCIAAAVVGGAVASSAIGAIGASDAASTQADAAANSAATQRGMYDQTRKDLQPYMTAGNTAQVKLSDLLANGGLGGNFTGADYLANKDPGYQFQLDQGNQALQNSQAAHDGVLSGSALKGLINYNQGMASTGYQSAYDRWIASQQNTYGQLHGVASLGENAAAQAGNTGSSYANSIGSTITGAGNAQAAGIIGSANAISGGINNGTGYLYLNSLRNGGGGGGSGAGSVINSDPYAQFALPMST